MPRLPFKNLIKPIVLTIINNDMAFTTKNPSQKEMVFGKYSNSAVLI